MIVTETPTTPHLSKYAVAGLGMHHTIECMVRTWVDYKQKEQKRKHMLTFEFHLDLCKFEHVIWILTNRFPDAKFEGNPEANKQDNRTEDLHQQFVIEV